MFFKPFTLPVDPAFPPLTVNIRDFGATESVLATSAIADAIDSVHSKGGGRVVIPAGNWRTGQIHLKLQQRLVLGIKAAVFPIVVDVLLGKPSAEHLTEFVGVVCRLNVACCILGAVIEKVSLVDQIKLLIH